MTIKEYITDKFQSFGITLSKADLFDVSMSVNMNDDMTSENRNRVYLALIKTVIPQWLLRAKTVSENGFSISWDSEALLKWYSWLCSELGIEDELNGTTSIEDGSDLW